MQYTYIGRAVVDGERILVLIGDGFATLAEAEALGRETLRDMRADLAPVIEIVSYPAGGGVRTPLDHGTVLKRLGK